MKIKGILKIIILLLLLFFLNTGIAVADSSIEFTDTYIDTEQYEQYAISLGQDEWTDPSQFDPYTNSSVYVTTNPVARILLWVLACLRAFAVGLAIIMIINTGLRYMMTREPEAKKMLKMQFPGTVLGIVLLFAGTAILKLISNFIEDLLAVV